MADKTLDIQHRNCEEEIHKCVHDGLTKVTQRLRRVGVNIHDDSSVWYNLALKEVKKAMQLIVNESEDYECHVMNICIDLLKQAEAYCKKLRIPMEPYGRDEKCLLDEKIFLKKRLEEYEVLLKEKQKETQNLQRRNLAVSKCLDEEPIPIDEDILPNAKEYRNILHQLEDREKIRFEREDTYIKTRGNIKKLMAEFQIAPKSDFQMIVMKSPMEEIILSQENMILLEEFYDGVLKESFVKRVADIKSKVQSMWNLVSVDAKYCDQFNQLYPDFTQSALEAYRNELHRCEEVRKIHIGTHIEKLRADIAEMWNNCHFSDEERDAFVYYDCAFYTEDLLEIHEREFERLEQFYAAKKKMFVLLGEHEQLWKETMQLERRNTSPSRLHNRGGVLLKEEKRRKAIQRKVPKIDAALLELAGEYERSTGKPFLSYGRVIQDIIDEKHLKLEQVKQEYANDRKLKKVELTPGKSCSTISLARSLKFTSDTKSRAKRTILSPRNATTSKKSRVLATSKREKIPIIKINGIHRENAGGLKKRQRLEKSRRLSDLLVEKGEEAYNEFTVQLCKANLQSNLQSSLLMRAEELAVPLPKTPSIPSRNFSPPRRKQRQRISPRLNLP